MSKRNRKSQVRGSVPGEAPIASSPEAPAALPRSRGATSFNPDYTHIRRDLKRIGLLAGLFILAMIIGSILTH